MSRPNSYVAELESILEPFLELVQQNPDRFQDGYEADGFSYRQHNSAEQFSRRNLRLRRNLKFVTFREGKVDRYTLRYISPDELSKLRKFVKNAVYSVSKESR
jgi:hypothetical protein